VGLPWAPARLTVLAGPSGVGKGTVAGLLAKVFPQIFLSTSATTRSPRPGEVDGQNYLFVSNERFEHLISDGALLEWARYSGHYYGTPREPVEQALHVGRPALLEIDLAGARQVRVAMPEALQVFLVPPSFEELERRLVERGTEPPAVRRARLEVAKRELAAVSEFDVVVVNDDVDQACAEVARAMGLEFPRRPLAG
jgi:guanylate kinase